ncbi:Hypothetical predicted protein [Pelobates cultripes]|uniref:Uncharacterized protein n=1 Tax=Pelobates cultripes TaxID=61616 RepID=A0AAD1WGR2_PELCU|nr:Hypothetical predicted protein [Pelobates cultripes]
MADAICTLTYNRPDFMSKLDKIFRDFWRKLTRRLHLPAWQGPIDYSPQKGLKSTRQNMPVPVPDWAREKQSHTEGPKESGPRSREPSSGTSWKVVINVGTPKPT